MSFPLSAEGVQVGQVSLPASTCFSISAALSSPRRGLQGVAGDQGQPGVAVRRLLAGLHDDARRFEFDQGVVGLGLVHRDVDDQPGRLEVVQQGVDLSPQLEEAAVVAGDGRLGEGQFAATPR